MSKKLRKRIRELCGLEGLERSERRRQAQQILDSPELKQQICNQMLGLSFRDIDKTMRNVLAENQPTPEEQEESELRRIAPHKFDPDAILESRIPRTGRKKVTYKTLTREETRKLIEASNKPIENEPRPKPKYDTYTFEEVQALLAGNYHPDMFKRKRKKKG